MPIPLRSGRCGRGRALCPGDAAAFEAAARRVLAEAGLAALYGASPLWADRQLGCLATAELWRLGARLAAAAPRRSAEATAVGYTRCHQLAMFIADELEARGVELP